MMTRLSRLAADRMGNIGVSAALVSPLIISSLALGVDYGSLTLQQRELQQAADLAAISAAASLADAEQSVANHLHRNGLRIPVRMGDTLVTAAGKFPLDKTNVPQSVATVVRGRYTSDEALKIDSRFLPTQISPDAVVVAVTRQADLFFASSLMEPPLLAARATAAARKEAAFSIGSRLASVNGGLLNGMLTSLLGTSITLDVMDYEALASAEIDLIKTIDLIGTDIGLTAGTYEDVLKSDITLPTLLKAMARSNSGSGSARINTAIDKIAKQLGKSQLAVDLDRLIDLGSLADRPLGSAGPIGLTIDALSLLTNSTALANRQNQIASQFNLKVPGIATATISLAIGEPPIHTPPAAVGEAGTTVRTAQTRVMIVLQTEKLAALGGLQLRIPLYLELAHAEAKLADITCPAGGLPAVKILAVPGIAELGLGELDQSAFANFGRSPRITTAKLLDSPLLDITALGYANASNMTATLLSFGPTDIAQRRVKSVSTSNTLTSLQTSLLKNLDLRVEPLGLSLGTPKLLQTAVADTLSSLTAPLDAILYNLLLSVGIKVGEADVRVTYATCRRPVLVQ